MKGTTVDELRTAIANNFERIEMTLLEVNEAIADLKTIIKMCVDWRLKEYDSN